MSTGMNDPVRCRWCGNYHWERCPAVKAMEFDPTTGVVTRVEFISMADYPSLSFHDVPNTGVSTGQSEPIKVGMTHNPADWCT